jgi:hypothetical protein
VIEIQDLEEVIDATLRRIKDHDGTKIFKEAADYLTSGIANLG